MKMEKENMIKLNLQLFNDNPPSDEGNKTPPQDEGNKNNEIDYDRIINGVVSKMQEGKKPEEKTDNPNVTNNNDDYIKKSVEWEMKYKTLNDEHSKLKNQLEDANNKLAEANNKLKDYETFGKTADEIKETSRIVSDYKKQQGGLIKL